MGTIRTPQPVMLIVAAFAARACDLAWGREKLVARCGPVVLESEPFCVDDFTTYYTATMGANLIKQLWGFETLIDAGSLASFKHLTNSLEDERVLDAVGVVRPINLDAGYVDLGKLILASTKDHAHRIYLSDGIFGETTLTFTRGAWTPLPWTYPDYREPQCHAFLTACREHIKKTRARQ
ncbi:MAG: DUF4416 family protein [Thermoguttaceae bacterium]